MTQRQITEVIVTVVVTGSDDRPAHAGYAKDKLPKVQDKDFLVETRFGTGDPEVKKYADWPTAAYHCCLTACRADQETFEILFQFEPGEEHRIMAYVPAKFLSGEHIGGGPMLQVEKQLDRRGFEADHNSGGMWNVHRPDPRDGYSRRGYFDAAQTIRLASGDAELVDEAIKTYWAAHVQTSQYARYLTMRGERRVAKKTEAAEETAKKQTTVKALDGTEVPVSPKQEEVLEQIRTRSASGSPLGSDDERLSDPDSIAAMKLATGEHPVVVRGKFGTRWHYFGKQVDLDKAVAAAEKAAEAEKASKASAKKPAKEAASGETAAKGGGRLKKPSEK